MIKMINAYKVMAEDPEGITLLGRPRYREEDNIKMEGCRQHSSGSG
jgi:hypothetical protein